jgi:hypothetical protein
VRFVIASYGLVIAGVLAYAARLTRARRRLAAEIGARAGSNRG